MKVSWWLTGNTTFLAPWGAILRRLFSRCSVSITFTVARFVIFDAAHSKAFAGDQRPKLYAAAAMSPELRMHQKAGYALPPKEIHFQEKNSTLKCNQYRWTT
jgi:hypothetical protein